MTSIENIIFNIARQEENEREMETKKRGKEKPDSLESEACAALLPKKSTVKEREGTWYK